MNNELRTNKAFTLIELVVAIGILAIVLSFASVIFRVSINAHRTAIANSEIMQKLRAITNQLNTDFKGLRKDGEIFVAWSARPQVSDDPNNPSVYERFDRIMFFADGDFRSYGVNPMVHGNIARICYMLAKSPPEDDPKRAPQQEPQERILARTQHILTADSALADFPDPNSFTDEQWNTWNNKYEYDKISLDAWKNISWEQKVDMLSVISDVTVQPSEITEERKCRGAMVSSADPNSIHMLLCEGVGGFKIQGWYDVLQRWVPQLDPDGDGDLADTHFFLDDPENVPGVLYPYPPFGGVAINNIDYPRELIDEAHFNLIPGLGRALKFTFTLYDSRGIIKRGRTFTHIVYLDN
ncbi:MAG: PulJ/GspJ family protein [Planctomycetota bacterium]|jgi:prepilin-type N-terminal cleavage/methylation domain-containing protein